MINKSIGKLLIAKTDINSSFWLPLWIHHHDTYNVMKYLLDEFTSESIVDSCGMSHDYFSKVAYFIALTHDIGKATVGFQYKIGKSSPERISALNQYLEIPASMDLRKIQEIPHALAGESILRSMNCPDTISLLIGAHHGMPTESGNVIDLKAKRQNIIGARNYFGDTEETSKLIKSVWNDILNTALKSADLDAVDDLPNITSQAQMILTALLISADWIASNTDFFPLISVDDNGENVDYEERVSIALENLNFPAMWQPKKLKYSDNRFNSTFGFPPKIVQKCMLQIIESTKKPGLFIFEAPMGCGKTEAALASAELLGAKCNKNGVFWGMPTQTTANSIFPRIINWAEKQSEVFYHSILLKHGSAALNETFENIQKGIPDEESDSGLVVHSWFCNSKKACLADFVVATVDQMLMMALKRKHVMLLHLGLSEKVVVIDEVHAYDAYMNHYLDRALQWLGAYHTPVILLSATLPAKRRMSFVRAYMNQKHSDEFFEKNMAYPLLTWTDGDEMHQESLPYNSASKTVKIMKTRDDNVYDLVRRTVQKGGCVGMILNTVSRAQMYASKIRNNITGNVLLYHAQYIMTDRAEKEKILLNYIGKDSTDQTRKGFVVVGTQVLEQSLDIDFDLLITDICPMDLLLQRIGRLHRHDLVRRKELEQPVCYVITDEYDNDKSGSQKIYGTWLMKKTLDRLPEKIDLPDDISPLVQQVYGAYDGSDEYKKYSDKNDKLVSKAKSFLLKKPTCKDIHGLLDRTINDNQAEASVRDGISSIEVLVLKQHSDGTLYFIDDTKLSSELTNEECKRVAKQKLRLPSRFSQKWNISETIIELEKKCKKYLDDWQKYYLLSGQLLLLLDENNETVLAGHHLKYEFESGLKIIDGSDEIERD